MPQEEIGKGYEVTEDGLLPVTDEELDRPGRERARKCPDRVRADKTYDARSNRSYLRRRRIKATIPIPASSTCNRQQCSDDHHFASSLVRHGCRQLRCEPSFIPVRTARRCRGTHRLPLGGHPRRRCRGRPGMASQFRLGLPGIPLVIGDGNNLPPASASIDVLTYAQAWHWTDQRKSVPEALRVRRPLTRPPRPVASWIHAVEYELNRAA